MTEPLPENLHAERSAAIAWQEMDPAMQTYVEARLAGTPPQPAARLAGYDNPAVRHWELEQDPRVLQYLRAAATARAHRQSVTRQDVLDGLMDATRMAATATELVSAWREIGKLIGAYEPQKYEVTVNDKRQLQEMSDEQLQQLAAIDGDFEVVSDPQKEEGCSGE